MAATTDVLPLTTLDLAALPPGTKTWFELQVPAAEPARGRGPIGVVVRGTASGPTGYIGSGMHGDELNSIEAVRRVAEGLDPTKVYGTVILVVLQNQAAFAAHTRLHPLDGKNLDHCFPGDANGSPSAALAHALYSELASRADYLVDLHCASRGGWNLLYSIIHGEQTHIVEESQALAAAFGCAVVLEVKSEPDVPLGDSIGSALDHNLFVQTARSGRPAAIIEFGGSAVLEESQVALGVRGILDVLRHRGQLDGAPNDNDTVFVDDATAVRSPLTGFLQLARRSGDRVRAGDTVGIVRPVVGLPESVHSPVDGVLLRSTIEATVAAGDRIVTIARTNA